MLTEASRRIRSASYSPEFNICVFAALLYLPWEFLQVPFFSGMPHAEHWRGITTCVRATLGDVIITLVAYGTVAIPFRRRHWLLQPTARELFVFIATGVAITVLIERMALAGTWLAGWTYSERMYVVPVLEVGLSPLLQWLLLPPLVVWFARRQMAAGEPQASQVRAATIPARTPLALGIAAGAGAKTRAEGRSSSLAGPGAASGSAFTSCVFLLDSRENVEFLPHSVYVALARAEAVVPLFAGQTFRLADWYLRHENGGPRELVSEWYGWVRFDGAGAFDPTASPAEGELGRPSWDNVDPTALPTAKERARIQQALGLDCGAASASEK